MKTGSLGIGRLWLATAAVSLLLPAQTRAQEQPPLGKSRDWSCRWTTSPWWSARTTGYP